MNRLPALVSKESFSSCIGALLNAYHADPVHNTEVVFDDFQFGGNALQLVCGT